MDNDFYEIGKAVKASDDADCGKGAKEGEEFTPGELDHPAEWQRVLEYEEETPEELAWKLVQTEAELVAAMAMIKSLCEALGQVRKIANDFLYWDEEDAARAQMGLIDAALARVTR